MSCSGPDRCLEWDTFLNQKQMRGPAAKPFILFVRLKPARVFSQLRQRLAIQWGKVQHSSGWKHSYLFHMGPYYMNVSPLGQWGLPTFPWATSSLWAAEADLTRALVAAAIDLAASKICSSKSKVSSACYNQKKTASHAIHIYKGHFLPNYLLLVTWCFIQLLLVCWQTTSG